MAIASSGLGHVARGVEAWAQSLAAALHAKGIETILCKGGGQAEAPYERLVPCVRRSSALARIRWWPRAAAWRLGLGSPYAIEQTTFALGLLPVLRRERIDLLHVQDPIVALWMERARHLGLTRVRTILAHGTEEPPEFLSRFEYLQHLTPEHAAECESRGINRPGWSTIPNFVDTEHFRPGEPDAAARSRLGIPPDALVVLCAAAIKSTHKRLDALLHEFALLRREYPSLPAWLVIAGAREPETDSILQLGRDLLGDRVRFLIQHPRDQMADLYRAADLFVLPSLFEMMPVALLEAMASGLPCLVHPNPVLARMVGPGGLPVEMDRRGALARALASTLADPSRRRGLGSAARNQCIAEYGQDSVVDRIVTLYYRTLGASFPSRRPRISVVIPAFNGGRWIQEAVRSVQAQTRPADEIVVIDDGSTDDTAQLAAALGVPVIRRTNQGVAAARNAGISATSGDLVAFLDADDVWHPRKLEIQARVLETRPELALIAAGTTAWPGRFGPVQDEAAETLTLETLAVRNTIAASSVLIRRSSLDQTGLFDRRLKGPEDYDLWLRTAERAPVAALRTPLVGYRTVPGSLGQRPASMECGLRRVLRKLERRGALRGRWLVRRKASSYVSYSCAYLYRASGNPRAALTRLVKSILQYPLPYRRVEVRMPLARARLLASLLLSAAKGAA